MGQAPKLLLSSAMLIVSLVQSDTSTAATIVVDTRLSLPPIPLTVACSATQSTEDVASGVALSDECTAAGVNGLGLARGVWGPDGLELGAAYQLILGGPDVPEIVFGLTYAWFGDTLTVRGGIDGDPGYLSLNFFVDGSLVDDGTYNTQAYATLYAGHYYGPTEAAALSHGINHIPLNIPIVFGEPLDLQIGLTASAYSGNGVTATVLSDFHNTASLQSVSVLDASGRLIAVGQVTSQAGLIYPVGLTPVPEPASLVLIGGGLIVALRRHRSGRRTS